MAQPETAGDRVYQAIREMIITGELPAGTRLVQRQLAAQFNTSNIPVVEAIRRLERDCLVVYHPNWGAQVRTWEPDDIEAAFVMREALESYAGRLFAERASGSERVALKEFARQFDDCVRREDLSAAVVADIDFHLHIVRCTRSTLLYQLAENTGVISASIKNDIGDNIGMGPVGVHDKILEALASKDGDAAAQACGAHVRGAIANMRGALYGVGAGV